MMPRTAILSLPLLFALVALPDRALANEPGAADEVIETSSAADDAANAPAKLAACQRELTKAYLELGHDRAPPDDLDDCQRALGQAYTEVTRDDRQRRDPAEAMPSLGGAFLQMVLVLGAVCLLAYLLLGKLLPKLMRVQTPTASRRVLEVVDRLPLDQRRALMVVKIAEQYFLVGASEGGISLLSKLDADDVRSALEASGQKSMNLGRLAGILLPRSQKEG